jgi:hypothetical protein
VHAPNAAPCDDGNLCTRSDTCVEGHCRGEEAVACAALDACHVAGECDAGTGACTNPPAADGAACDDGNACTTADVCRKGRCRGGPPPDCDDDNPCTDDACNAAAGCVHAPNAAPCDDGNLCTQGDVCVEGRCTGGPRAECDDGNACTDDSCDPAAGCEHTDNGGRCDGKAAVAAARKTQRSAPPAPTGRVTAATGARRPPMALARGPVWRIQLAAVRSAEIAESLVERFRDRYVDLVGDLDLAVERVDLGPGKGVYYRVQGGAFSDRVSAAEVCEALTRREVECVVVSRN